jgi:hypothetical protein
MSVSNSSNGVRGRPHIELSCANTRHSQGRTRGHYGRSRADLEVRRCRLSRCPAACSAPGQLAARNDLAREAAAEYSRQQLATRYRIWGARADDRELLTNQSRARDRRRPHQSTRCLWSARLLDVMECGKTNPCHGICQRSEGVSAFPWGGKTYAPSLPEAPRPRSARRPSHRPSRRRRSAISRPFRARNLIGAIADISCLAQMLAPVQRQSER